MSLLSLLHAIRQLPPALQEEVAHFVAFLQVRPRLVEGTITPKLVLPDYEQVLDPAEFAIQEAKLTEWEALWEDEAEAEILCALLTA